MPHDESTRPRLGKVDVYRERFHVAEVHDILTRLLTEVHDPLHRVELSFARQTLTGILADAYEVEDAHACLHG